MDFKQTIFFVKYAQYLAEQDMENKNNSNAEAVASILNKLNV